MDKQEAGERQEEQFTEGSDMLERIAQREREVKALNERAVVLLNDRARVIEDLERKNKENTAMLSMARAVGGTLDVQQVIEIGLEEGLKALEVEGGCVHLLENGKLVLKACRGLTPEAEEELACVEVGRGIFGEVARTKERIVVDDLDADPRRVTNALPAAGYRAVMSVPLQGHEGFMGVVGASTRLKRCFSEEEGCFMEAIAGQMSGALKNALLFQQVEERNEELSFLARITHIVASALDFKEMCDAVVTELKKLIDVDWSALGTIEGDRLRFQSLFTGVGSAWQEGESIPLAGTGSEWAAKNKEVLVEEDLLEKRLFGTGEKHLQQGIRSIAYVPLVSDGEAFAVMIFGSLRPGAYGERERGWLEHLAWQLAPGIKKGMLHAELKEERDKLVFISRLSRIIACGTSVEAVYGDFVAELRKIIDADWASLVLIKGDKLWYYALETERKGLRRAGESVPLEGTTTEWVSQHKEPVVQNDLSREEEGFPSGKYVKLGLKSVVHLPLVSRGEVFGCFIVGSLRPGAYGDGEMECLRHLAWQLAPVISPPGGGVEYLLEK